MNKILRFIFKENFSFFELFCFMLITPLISASNNYWYFLLYVPVIMISVTMQMMTKLKD